MSAVLTLPNCIGGRFVPPTTGHYLDDVAPATGEVVARVPRSGPEDVDAAVSAAQQALDGSWGRSSFAERADLLDAIASALERRHDELVALESQDTGKPRWLAGQVDIPRAVSNFRFFAGAVRHQETSCHPMAQALNYTLRCPVGVAALVTPWNLPLYLLTWKTAPALAMGNAVVAKPSEITPQTASALAEIIHELGLPAGVFNLVHGDGAGAGAPLVGHPGVSLVSFTGGTATGARVAAAAAPTFKKLSLELGGKNPTLVFADCDFESTVRGVLRASFANQGQVCLCGERLLVERSIADRFVSALAEGARGLAIGDPSEPETRFGSLISQAHRDKVDGYVQLAREEGGTVVCGGKIPELPAALSAGAFYEPTLITGLRSSARAATEEVFGPFVTVHPFDSDEEAVAMANAVDYGLCASVWTRDLGRAHRVSAALETGMVWVNTWLLRDLRVPFGGEKNSGVGREGGRHSLEFFSESRNICVQL